MTDTLLILEPRFGTSFTCYLVYGLSIIFKCQGEIRSKSDNSRWKSKGKKQTVLTNLLGVVNKLVNFETPNYFRRWKVFRVEWLPYIKKGNSSKMNFKDWSRMGCWVMKTGLLTSTCALESHDIPQVIF